MYIDPRSPVRTGFKKAPPTSTSLATPDTSSQPIQSRSSSQGISIVKTLIWLAPLVTLLPYFLAKLHYSLPEPRTET